jgi:hypothetical protein
MANTKAGGKKHKQTLLEKLGSEEAVKAYYRKIGAMGGAKSRGGGFGSDKVGKDGLTGAERARLAGIKGGKATRIPSNLTEEQKKRLHNLFESNK